MGASAIGWEWGEPGAFPSRVFFDKVRLFNSCLVWPIPRFPSSFLDDLFLRSPCSPGDAGQIVCSQAAFLLAAPPSLRLAAPSWPLHCSMQPAETTERLSPVRPEPRTHFHPTRKASVRQPVCHLISPGALDPGERSVVGQSHHPRGTEHLVELASWLTHKLSKFHSDESPSHSRVPVAECLLLVEVALLQSITQNRETLELATTSWI